MNPGRYKDGRGYLYEVGPSGAMVRIHPQRPWRGKSERRQVIRQRREARKEEA